MSSSFATFENNDNTGVSETGLTMKNKEKTSTITEWLALIPRVPSHYCRSTSNRTYVESTFLSKSHMYSVFEDWCKENNKKYIPSRITFCKVLDKEKISIHMPRKDLCDTCYEYNAGNLNQEDYNAHRIKKQEARDAKQKAKNEATNNKVVITMDLQSVLLCPKLQVSKIYYSQKLQVHNLQFA
ncbi:hypothetical protein RI129_009553 [Pyrocoelia pectoralis]|uniref:Uncharacterized protein n=1 Tax=Pyrocoelia pectoralis TaxID=417401 RepID=A0AAN7V8P8_9COLE